MELWHKRLGHLHVNGVKGLQSMGFGIDLSKGASQILPCEGCVEGKQARASFPSDGGIRATQVLESYRPLKCWSWCIPMYVGL